MNVWKIDDKISMKHCDELEAKFGVANSSHIDVNVDHVSETQFETIPRKFHSGPSTLHVHLREIVSTERLGHQIGVDGNKPTSVHPISSSMPGGQRTYPNCYCGDMCAVVVCGKEKNAERRFFGCSSYNKYRLNTREVDCCNYFKWIDQPWCEMGLEYAYELQAEINRLKKVNAVLRESNERPRFW